MLHSSCNGHHSKGGHNSNEHDKYLKSIRDVQSLKNIHMRNMNRVSRLFKRSFPKKQI